MSIDTSDLNGSNLVWKFLNFPEFSRSELLPFKLLGILDVENIPCARDSILYGSLGSVVAGLGHFLLTSRIRRSCDAGVGGFVLVTLGCWFHCRYNYAKERIRQRTAREGMKNKILYESTHLDPERKKTNSSN
ncbi:cytochrome c oxidase assembly protein COX20, mitochondrial [Fukomys damarensis]|uniref:cytochrome c oxidase assembly protein COX20, mitochondrial n=1 Tax=Fukomys damarensis TaxID=885580 RepID=UPI0014558D9A|nr:cytochrome c oxidase assembly protein COX20, mitochondrial [Fukomys damarensis]